MHKSTTHFKDVSRLISTTVDRGRGSVIPTCRRNSHLRALLKTFPFDSTIQQQKPLFIPNNSRRSNLIRRFMSNSAATLEPLPASTTTTPNNNILPTTTSFPATTTKKSTSSLASSPSRLQGSLDLFNLSDRVALADLDHAIQIRNSDKAWTLFVTLSSKHDTIPFSHCCSLYTLLNYAKRLAGGNKSATKLRQRQLDQLLDYVQQRNSTSSFLSSIQEIPISGHKLLLKAIRSGNQREAWNVFFKLHQNKPKDKFPRNICFKLMTFVMKDKSLDKNQLKMRLQLIALHGSGTSEYDNRYISSADVLRLAYICHGYEKKSSSVAHNLVDEFLTGINKKKKLHRADALDELIWRVLTNDDLVKARQILNSVQSDFSDKVDINEAVFINMMNAYRRKRNYHESLKLFEQLLVETKTGPSVAAFNAILRIFVAQGSVERAAYIYETMTHLGVAPDAATFTELIRTNIHSGQLKTCVHYYNQMLQHNISPNVYTFSALIEASTRRNDLKSALKWFQVMLDRDIQPNHVVITCILKSLSTHHLEYPSMSDAVIKIAHQAAMAGIKTDAVLYTILLKLQAESMGIEGALKIHREMLAQAVEPNSYTYTILIHACGKNRMPETAEKIFDLMKKSKQHQPNSVTYTALMDAWSKVDRRDKVDAVILEFLKNCKSDKTGRLWLDTRIRERLRCRCC